jgi:hypothetical protein
VWGETSSLLMSDLAAAGEAGATRSVTMSATADVARKHP